MELERTSPSAVLEQMTADCNFFFMKDRQSVVLSAICILNFAGDIRCFVDIFT